MKTENSIANHNEVHTILCPNCSWRSHGKDLIVLRREKDAHAMFECPLPAQRVPLRSAS